MRRINEALLLTLLVLGSPLARSQNQYSSCERADDGRPICTDAATGKMVFVGEEAFKTYAAHSSGIDTGSVAVEAGTESGTLKYPQSCEESPYTYYGNSWQISLKPSEAEKLGVDLESLNEAWNSRIPRRDQYEDSNGVELWWGFDQLAVRVKDERKDEQTWNLKSIIDGGIDGKKAACLKLLSLVDQALVNQAKNLKNAKEKEVAAKEAAEAAEAQLKAQRIAEFESKAAERSKFEANALAQWTAYVQRDKTLLEKIVNYSLVSDEAGIDTTFAISGDKGNDDCVVTIYRKQASDDVRSLLLGSMRPLEPLENVDIRKFNEEGFRISRKTLPGCCTYWRYGDDKQNIESQDDVGQLMERLTKAWGLAFQQCPGKKSEF
jgi:hypothetical protein